MSFKGKVRAGQTWYRIVIRQPVMHGYCGKPIPTVTIPGGKAGRQTLLQGERGERMTTEKVVNEWVRSLRVAGRAVTVEDDGEFVTVTAP